MTIRGVTGVVLAGGDSRRFGDENKALATYRGETFIERAVGPLLAVTDRPPLVVTRNVTQRRTLAEQLPTSEITFVTDVDAYQGPLAGLVAAVTAASTPWLFVAGCDMPLLAPDAISWLGDYLEPGVDAVTVETTGGREPLHAFYRRSAVRQAVASLPSRAGLQAVLGELESVRSVPTSRAPDDVAISTSIENVNTKGELSALLER